MYHNLFIRSSVDGHLGCFINEEEGLPGWKSVFVKCGSFKYNSLKFDTWLPSPLRQVWWVGGEDTRGWTGEWSSQVVLVVNSTVVNSAAMNIGVHVSFWIVVFAGYMPSSGIAGTYGSYIPSVLGLIHTVLHSGCSIYIPTNRARGFPFLHILSSIYSL